MQALRETYWRVSDMRRPLIAELGAEDRSLARRWATAFGSFYSIILVALIAAVLASSTADKAATDEAFVVARSERKDLAQDRSVIRPYGSLPNMVQPISACAALQPCMAVKASGAGEEK
jgi:hypothetical protein